MFTGERHEDSSEVLTTGLPPLKWSRETFDDMVRNFKFPDSWDARYPDKGQTAADAPAGYITFFWDFFSAGNFRLPVTKFFLKSFRITSFIFPKCILLEWFGCVTSNSFAGFYSFVQRASAKKILLKPRKSFNDWKPKFFYIKADVILMKMSFRDKEDVVPETIQTTFLETWYQDLKDVPSIALPENFRNLVPRLKGRSVNCSARESPGWCYLVLNFS
ncbi:hypothetical protein Hanom_Chr06g00492581 [Helianthus anomalus]